jgi:putative aminopeptidase FrvX
MPPPPAAAHHILGDKGAVPGIIGNTAIHLRRDDHGTEKAPAVHDLWVDVGASNEAEVAKLGLRVGHPAVYQDGPMELANKRIVGRALDNRIGSYIIAQVMKRVAPPAASPPSPSSASMPSRRKSAATAR